MPTIEGDDDARRRESEKKGDRLGNRRETCKEAGENVSRRSLRR